MSMDDIIGFVVQKQTRYGLTWSIQFHKTVPCNFIFEEILMPADCSFTSQRILPQSWIDSRIEVRSSPIHGRGIFATSPIQQGEVVIIWGGTLFSLDDIRAGKAVEHSYAAIREEIFLGHTREQGNSADDYMNHSCDPNIWMINEICHCGSALVFI